MTRILSRQGTFVAPFCMWLPPAEPLMHQLALLSPSLNLDELMKGLGESLDFNMITHTSPRDTPGHVNQDQTRGSQNYKADIEEIPPVPPYSPPWTHVAGHGLAASITPLKRRAPEPLINTLWDTSSYKLCSWSSHRGQWPSPSRHWCVMQIFLQGGHQLARNNINTRNNGNKWSIPSVHIVCSTSPSLPYYGWYLI